MAKRASGTMAMRIRCRGCGRVDRVVTQAASAFAVADGLMRAPCPGGRGRPCHSRDRQVDLRAVNGG